MQQLVSLQNLPVLLLQKIAIYTMTMMIMTIARMTMMTTMMMMMRL